MLQTKFFSAQAKVKEELELRYSSVVCQFQIESSTGRVVIEQYHCKLNDTESEKIQAQFVQKSDDLIEVILFKLTQLASHKI